MPRARFAVNVALAVAFAGAGTCASAAVQLGCTLSDEYSSDYGADGGPDERLDASAPGDASSTFDVSVTSDSARVADADADADADAGPWGDYCDGVPTVTLPEAGAVVGQTFSFAVSAPPCIAALALYLNSNPTPVVKTQGSTFSGTITVTDAGPYTINANGWNHTDTAHTSQHVSFTVTLK